MGPRHCPEGAQKQAGKELSLEKASAIQPGRHVLITIRAAGTDPQLCEGRGQWD